MTLLLDILLAGIVLGGMYALIAMGRSNLYTRYAASLMDFSRTRVPSTYWSGASTVTRAARPEEARTDKEQIPNDNCYAQKSRSNRGSLASVAGRWVVWHRNLLPFRGRTFELSEGSGVATGPGSLWLKEVPEVTVEVLEYGDSSVGLILWLENERDTLDL
jgi:hypothetical protein